MPLCLALAASLGGSSAAVAQTVFRCGDSYSQQPCPGGKAIEADDPRTAGQRSQTSEAARRDAQAADAMEKARLKEEAKPAQAIVPPARAETPEQPPRPTTADAVARKPAHFTAVSPAKKATAQPGKKKKKAKKTPATV
jgi:hypothetical protein